MAIADHRLTLTTASPEPHRRAKVQTPEWSALRWPAAVTPDGPWLSDEDDEPVLTMLGVHKTYGEGQGEVVALDGVRARRDDGRGGAIGPGKTTLLNLAAGWDRPDRGTVERPGGADPVWAEVAFVPQHLGLMDELSVRENVEYPARLARRLAEHRPLVDDLLDRLGLTELQHRSPRRRSANSSAPRSREPWCSRRR